MNNELLKRVETLDDKQAIYVAQKLAQTAFQDRPQVPWDEIARDFEAAARERAGIKIQLSRRPEWNKLQLKDADAGVLARAVLAGWVADAGLAPALEKALAEFKTPKQDLGIISVGVAIGLTYVLISARFKIKIGSFEASKEGLTPEQQADVIKNTIKPITKLMGAGGG